MKKILVAIICAMSMLSTMVTAFAEDTAAVPEYDFDLFKDGVLAGELDTATATGITIADGVMTILPKWADQKIVFETPFDITSLASTDITLKMNIKADALRNEDNSTATMEAILYDGNGYRKMCGASSPLITTTAGDVKWSEWYRPSSESSLTFDDSNIVAIGVRVYPNDTYNATSFTVNRITLDFDGVESEDEESVTEAQVPEYDVAVFADGTPNGAYDASDRMYINENNNLIIRSVDWTDRWIKFDTPVDLSSYSSSFTLKIKTKVNELAQGSSGTLVVFLKDAEGNRLQGEVSSISDSFAEFVITPAYKPDGDFNYANIAQFGFRTFPANVNGSSIEFESIILDIASLNSGVKVLSADEILNDGTFTAYSLVDTQQSFVTIETAQRAENDSYVKITPLKSWGITTTHVFDYTYDASDCKDTAAIKLSIKSDGDSGSGAVPAVKLAVNDGSGNKIVFDLTETVTEQWQSLTLKLEDGVKNDGNSDTFDYGSITKMYFYFNGLSYGIDDIKLVPESSQPQPVVSTKLYVADWETSEGEYKEAQTFAVGDDMQIVTTVENVANYGVVLAYYADDVLESVVIKPYAEAGVYTFEEVYSENADMLKVFVWDAQTMLPIGTDAEFFAE